MKKCLSLLLTLCLCLTMLSGVTAAAAEGKPAITMMMYGDNTPTEDNSVIRALEEKLGIDLTVIYVPLADYTAKLNTLVAARTLPDLFLINGTNMVVEDFRDQGMLLKLDDLLNTKGPDILKEIGPIIKNSPVNQKDGVYAVFPASLDYASNFAVRTDWLSKLNLKMPTNLDELYDVLKAFTTGDPDGNGQNDTVGYVGSMANMRTFEHIFGAYGICVDKPYLMEDGTVTTYMKAPLYLDAIKYLRKLYQDGILDPDFATIPLMSAFEKLWTGHTGVFDFQAVGTTNNWMPGRYTENPPPTFDFTILAGPGGKGGPIKMYPRYTFDYAISSTSKNPEKAMELLNYLFSEEGDELTYLGVEGLHYEWVDKAAGKFKKLDPYTDAATHRADGGYVYNSFFPANNTEVRTLNEQTRKAQELARANGVDYPKIIKTLKADSENGAALKEITMEAFAQLIVTTGDVDAEYAAFVARWEEEGGLDYEAEATAAYAEQLATQAAK